MGFWYYCFVGAAYLTLEYICWNSIQPEYMKKIDKLVGYPVEEQPQLHESFAESFNESNREFKYYD